MVDSVTSARIELGYHNFYRYRWAGRADAAATAAASTILGDALFGESARLIARGLSRHEPKTFFYLFSRGVAGRELAATHSEVLPYLFGSLDKPSFIPHAAPDRTDLELSRTLRQAWVRFATSDDPNGDALPHWPHYDRATDFCAVARAFGVPAVDLASVRWPDDALQHIFAKPGAALIRVPIAAQEHVLPMVAPGMANTEAIE